MLVLVSNGTWYVFRIPKNIRCALCTKKVNMTNSENNFNLSMTIDPLHYAALEIARSTLAGSGLLHSDALFDGPSEQDNIVYGCFNPARAAGDALVNKYSIMSIVDSNFISGLRRILKKNPGDELDQEGLEIISFLVLSAMCDGAITPGMAFLEMHANVYGLPHLMESYNAFEFLCTEVDLDILCTTLIHKKTPYWDLSKPLASPIPKEVNEGLRNLTDITRYKSELFSSILAATIEMQYDKSVSNSKKFEIFVNNVHDRGAFAMGSLRYFALYFSERPSKLGIERKTMLKSIHSRGLEKVRRAVLNAASDCYFSSEYSSSINSFGKRGSPRIFFTSDSALKVIMRSEFDDRSFWNKGISAALDFFRDDKMSRETAKCLDEAIPMFDVGNAPEVRPPVRPSAQRFIDHQDEALQAAWDELMSVL